MPGGEEWFYGEQEEDRLATPQEAAREYGRNAGMDNPDRPWILTPWDTWERNPCYQGPPAPHPEDDDGEFADAGPIFATPDPVKYPEETPPF